MVNGQSLLLQFRDKTPDEILSNAIGKGINDFIVGLTGGKDSVVVADFLFENYPSLAKGCVYADTGVGLQETKDFVKDYCNERGWKLEIRKPKLGNDYESIVKEYGFPSYSIHDIIMRKLKIIPIREYLASRTTKTITSCLVSGVRKKESQRRFIRSKKPIHKDHIWFVSPMIDKSNVWMYNYFTEHKLKKSPVYQTLHISGDCLCGCFSDKSEAKVLDVYYPKLAEFLRKLEQEIKFNSAIPEDKRTWGNQHSLGSVKNQTILSEFCYECSQDRIGNSNEMLADIEKLDKELREIKQ